MKSQDPASLQNLNDIVIPLDVGWWPLASGWYYLSGLLLIVLTWFVYRMIRNWSENRYRRTALHQLQLLASDIEHTDRRDAGLRQLPILLKRTALSVFPRTELASLTGKKWLDFLNSKVSKASFNESMAALVDQLSYSVGDLDTVDSKAAEALLKSCRHWLEHHQPDHQPGRPQKPGQEDQPC